MPTRRKFLAQAASAVCSAGAFQLAPQISYASAATEHRLVVILLRGAMDGMDVVRPIGDPLFRKYRPSTSGQIELPLDNFYGLHPSLKGLWQLWENGELAIGQAVSTPYRDRRSHFDGQALLEAGLIDQRKRSDSGWLNRALQLMPGANSQTAFAIGLEEFLILKGNAEYSKWYPGPQMKMSPQGQRLLEMVSENDQLFHSALSQAMLFSDSPETITADGNDPSMSAGGMKVNSRSDRLLERATAVSSFLADRLNEDTRIATFSLGGWDTHIGQAHQIKSALGPLEQSILTLKSKLTHQAWENTTILCVTEFGRTARENGAAGTDHGTASIMIGAGGAIRGKKVYGNWPGLDSSSLYLDRDLMPSADLRIYMAEALRSFGLSKTQLTKTVFPDLDQLDFPGFLL